MRRRTDTQTDTHTDAGDHNTFRVAYDSREMQQMLQDQCRYVERLRLTFWSQRRVSHLI